MQLKIMNYSRVGVQLVSITQLGVHLVAGTNRKLRCSASHASAPWWRIYAAHDADALDENTRPRSKRNLNSVCSDYGPVHCSASINCICLFSRHCRISFLGAYGVTPTSTSSQFFLHFTAFVYFPVPPAA